MHSGGTGVVAQVTLPRLPRRPMRLQSAVCTALWVSASASLEGFASWCEGHRDVLETLTRRGQKVRSLAAIELRGGCKGAGWLSVVVRNATNPLYSQVTLVARLKELRDSLP